MERSAQFDIVFLGGGLVNSLLAWQTKKTRPWLKILILEKNRSLGGKHTWSFHESDLSESGLKWLSPLLSASWPFYDVQFPDFHRRIETRYFSIRSEKFHEFLSRELADQVRFGVEVKTIDEKSICLASGEKITSQIFVDGRGIELHDLVPQACGFQKFVGLEIETKEPHGLEGPILMDAKVAQLDGYRFMYCLPWSERRILVEDTSFSETPQLDKEGARREILNYCRERGWEVVKVHQEEEGCLPLPVNMNFILNSNKVLKPPSLFQIGMRSGLLHPTTGYSLLMAVKTIDYLLSIHSHQEWPKAFKKFRDNALKQQRFYVLLNRVMFQGNSPQFRYRFLEHFYRLPHEVISRFYAHQMDFMDKMRFFLRRPPVEVKAALKAVRNGEIYATGS